MKPLKQIKTMKKENIRIKSNKLRMSTKINQMSSGLKKMNLKKDFKKCKDI